MSDLFNIYLRQLGHSNKEMLAKANFKFSKDTTIANATKVFKSVSTSFF